jgi:hypothetical protein
MANWVQSPISCWIIDLDEVKSIWHETIGGKKMWYRLVVLFKNGDKEYDMFSSYKMQLVDKWFDNVNCKLHVMLQNYLDEKKDDI